jgi:hypothetical protein
VTIATRGRPVPQTPMTGTGPDAVVLLAATTRRGSGDGSVAWKTARSVDTASGVSARAENSTPDGFKRNEQCTSPECRGPFLAPDL